MSRETPEKRDPARDAERARRRRERTIIIVIAALLAALTLVEAKLGALSGGVRFTDNIVVFALINLNVIFIVLLIFLVSRNLFKIILDRKRNVLGARLRSRLVLIFILFSLIPTFLLFFAAANITTTSIRSWIGGRVGGALSGALEVVQESLEREAESLEGLAERAAEALEADEEAIGSRRALEVARAGEGPSVALIVVGPGGPEAVAGEISPALTGEIASRSAGAGHPGGTEDAATFVGDSYAAAARRLPGGRIVVAVRTLPPKTAAHLREVAKTLDAYHQIRLLDDPIRASYLGLLVLITLLIVFAASWMGIYLARQITVPVQLLAEGTEKVARGDLDARIEYSSDDELGTLVSSFNRMTADLKAMKGNIEAANLSLAETYDELRRRTQFIETILTNISTGVIVIDRHGRIVMINKVAERILGIKVDKVLGQPYKEVVREEHYDVVRGLSRQVSDAASGQVERQVVVHVGGKRISLRVSVTLLQDEAGGHLGLVVAFDDLSQAMRLQRVMAWREVARRIAHEIRNPLTPIQLSTERLRKRFAAAHAGDDVFAECTGTILSEVDSLTRLVEEFNRFARMPAPAFKEGWIGEELRPVVETFRSAYPGIAWEYDPDGVPPVFFDAFQIRRALTNLLENAAAALRGNGRVAVACAYDPEAGLVRIAVADDGPGIPPEDRDRLFEPYFSRKEGGTGLGLAIVSAIASDHGGTVRVRDNVPRGAVFEIEFPARQAVKGEG